MMGVRSPTCFCISDKQNSETTSNLAIFEAENVESLCFLMIFDEISPLTAQLGDEARGVGLHAALAAEHVVDLVQPLNEKLQD